MNVGKALKRETVFTQLPSGMYEVSLDYFPYFPNMDNCKVEATRQLMEKAFNCKCKDTNTQILTKLCQLRYCGTATRSSSPAHVGASVPVRTELTTGFTCGSRGGSM